MKPESKQTKPAVRSRLSMAMILGLLVVLAACGGSGDEAGGSEAVATLEGGDTDEQAVATEAEGEPGDGSSESTETGEATAEENALAFAACMRANGIDFADPTVDADGNPTFEGGFGGGGAGNGGPPEGFREAIQICQEETGGFALGGGRGGPRGGNPGADFQEALLPYTECLRDEGLDVGDVTFGGGPGAGGPGAGGNPGAGAGDGAGPGRGNRGAGGDPTTRIGAVLGLDVEDPAVIAAMSTCEIHLEDAFGNFGGGGGGGFRGGAQADNT